MSRLLQVSDPHFGTEQRPVMEALVALAQQLAPDVLVLSGDITQRARRAQFGQARAFVDRLGIAQVLAIPGNHDIPLFNLPVRILRPYANHQRSFGADLEPLIELPDLLVIGVNTTRPWRHKHGSVSTAQVTRVARRLRAARPQQLRVVVTHQPLHVYRRQDAVNLLRGHEAAVRQWAQAGADLVMGGHIHLPYVRPLREHYPDLARAMWCVQAGTAVSSRVRSEAANSVNLVQADTAAHPPRCHVERWDYQTTGRFELVDATALPLDRDTPP